MKMKLLPPGLSGAFMISLALSGCIDPIPSENDRIPDGVSYGPPLSEIAAILAALPLETEHMSEVHHAVTSSSGNGYDEEYTMTDLFSVPGAGVGDSQLRTKSIPEFENPVSELIPSFQVHSEHFGRDSRLPATVPARFMSRPFSNSLRRVLSLPDGS